MTSLAPAHEPTEPVGVTRTPTPDAPAAASARSPAGPAPAALDGLRATLGNRDFGAYVRTLARQPAAQAAQAAPPRPVTVYLAGPPPPIHASERATMPNRKLAALIDEIDKLTNAQVIERRRSEVLEAETPGASDPVAHQLALEAAEYVASYRHLEPLKPYYTVDTPTNRRRDIRVALEEGVREHHSFKKAFAELSDTAGNDDARQFFAREADAFRPEFSRQANATALAMLNASQDEMERVLGGYGLPVAPARYAAERIAGYHWTPEAGADSVVEQAFDTRQVNTDEHVHQRVDLAQTVGRLKQQKALMDKLEREAGQIALDVPMNATGPKADAMMKKKEEAQAERLALRRMWIEAERKHPILLAYRHGREVEHVDLGTLDTDPVNTEMRGVLIQLLPKLGDLLEAKRRIMLPEKHGDHLSALSIPSVVAMTKANMFIPRNSIRDGIANDLADEAGTESRWIMLGAILLAIVTFIPSGGASLGIVAGMASVALSAYSAVHEWEQYTKQKMLSDTDLDIARSLSSQEPSLTPFVISLISLGLEPLVLLSAFNKARKLKVLSNSGDDTGALVNELNQIGQKAGKPDLGKEALEDIEAGEQEAKAAGRAGGVHAPVPVIEDLVLGFGSRDEVRAELLTRFTAIGGELPKRWDMVVTALKDNDGPINRQILALLPGHMSVLRDPEAWADVIADAWEIAAKMEKPNLRDALLELAKRRGIETVTVRKILGGGKFFKKVVAKGKGIIDPKLAVGADGVQLHGELTHLIQDLVIDSKLGRGASAKFRTLLKKSEGKIERFMDGKSGAPTKFGAYDGVKNQEYNVTWVDTKKKIEKSMTTGDYVWRFTYDLFYLDPALRRLPQPERVGPLLDELFELK